MTQYTTHYAQRAMEQEKNRQQIEKKRDHVAKLTGAHTTDPIKDYKIVRQWLKIAEEHDANRQRGGAFSLLFVFLIVCYLRFKDSSVLLFRRIFSFSSTSRRQRYALI